MDYLVTGGMGFIGRHTVAALHRAYPDAQIMVLDNLSLSDETKQTDLGGCTYFVNGDVRDADLVADLVGQTRRGVVHLAADSRVLPSLQDPAKVLESAATNVMGTANILVALAKREDKIGFVYAGSSTAYGNATPQVVTFANGSVGKQGENDLPSVQSPYSATKLAAEELVRSFVVTFGIRATVLRYFQVYGPGQPTTGAYALVTGVFLRQYAAGVSLTIEGDGTQSRDFVHVTDVARANVLALLHDSGGLPINIGSGQTHSIKELADLISPNQTHLPARRIDLKATHADISRAERILGWTPTIPLRYGIAQLKGALTGSE